jgi:hypothetical protein
MQHYWIRSVTLTLTLVLSAAVAMPQVSPYVQKRVSPDEYTGAPVKIRTALKEQHCELPGTQHWDNTRLNIVSGHFGDPAQTDWAAICIAPT